MKRFGIFFSFSVLSAFGAANAVAQHGGYPAQPTPPALAPGSSTILPTPDPYLSGESYAAPTIVAGNAACSHGACGTGSASCGSGSEQSAFWTAYYRNVHWPSPFKVADINAVTSYFELQKENGWRSFNTVGNAYFNSQNQFTEAGKNHLRSILANSIDSRRGVYVLQGDNPQLTAQRVEAVQVAISALIPTGDLPPVYTTDRDVSGSPGAYQVSAYNTAVSAREQLPGRRFQSYTSTGSSGQSSN